MVLRSTGSTYDNFNTGFGTVTVGGKFENRVRRLPVRGAQVYKYPLVAYKSESVFGKSIKKDTVFGWT